VTTAAPKRQITAILGSTFPRIATAPLVTGRRGPCGCGCSLTRRTSYGFAVDDFARDVLNRPLDPWQRYLVIHAGELLPDGRPRFRQVLVLVARQNGKTELLVILTLYWMYVEHVPLALGTSTKLQYARESWKKAVKLARSIESLAVEIPRNGVRQANGEEELELASGSRYLIAASNEEGGRSLTIHRLVMDELRQHHSWDAYNAAVPATNAVPDAQVWMISNAGDDRSVVLNDLRDQAMEGQDWRLGIFEWSSPSPMAATDLEALAMANPNLGRRIDIDAIMGDALRAEAKGGEQLAKFLTENHCRRVSLLNPAIDLEAWAECLQAGDLDGLRDSLAFCLDVSLDELHATLYAAAVDGERVRIDAVAAWEGQTAVAQMCAELPDLVKKIKPRVLGWFPHGPAATAAASLAQRSGWPPTGVKLEPIRGDVTAVCMGFAEQVRSKAIARGDDPLLDAHVRAAEKAYHGDGWRFTRKGAGQVDAAYAAAGAVHLARTLPVAPRPRVSVLSW
jgi:hypothetical protein